MGYAQYLRDALGPLAVYDLRAASFSGAEIEALGTSLDAIWVQAQNEQRETIVMQAEDSGLSNWESLFPWLSAAQGAKARREAIGAFVSIADDSFTQAALSRCLAACGVACAVAETDTYGTLAVSFPGVGGEPENFSKIQEIIEEILPCHLAIDYLLFWCLWGDVAHLTWGEVAHLTWGELQLYGL